LLPVNAAAAVGAKWSGNVPVGNAVSGSAAAIVRVPTGGEQARGVKVLRVTKQAVRLVVDGERSPFSTVDACGW